MTVLRLAQNLSTSPRLKDLVRFLDSEGQAEWTMSDLLLNGGEIVQF